MRPRRGPLTAVLALGGVLVACAPRSPGDAGLPDAGPAPVAAARGTATKQPRTADDSCPPRVAPDLDDPEACHPDCSCLRGAWVCTPSCGLRLSDLKKTSDVIVELRDGALGQELDTLLEPWRRDELLALSEPLTTSRRQFQGLTWGLLPPRDQAALQAKLEAFAKRQGPTMVRLHFRDPRAFRLRLIIERGAVVPPPRPGGLDVQAAVRDVIEASPQVDYRLGSQSGEGDLELIYSLEALPASERQALLRDLRALAKRVGPKALRVDYAE